MNRIPKPHLEKSRIPHSAAEQLFREDLESNPFIISFRVYNNKVCEIESLVKNMSKKALMDLKIIGRDLTTVQEFANKGIKMKSVKRIGSYKTLFSGLSEDIEMFEHKLQGTGRIFYFLDKTRKIFNVVAITNSHFETKKTRR